MVKDLNNKKLFGASITIIVAIFVIIAFLYSGLISQNNAEAKAIDTYATTESVDYLSDSMNNFSLNLLFTNL